MNPPRPPARPSQAASRRRVLAALKQDHRTLDKAFRDFEKLSGATLDRVQRHVERTLALLGMHAAAEAEVIYPALRTDPRRADRLDEAQAQHAAMADLSEAIRAGGPADPGSATRFRVLGEYFRHHVREEEDDLLAELERAPVDWDMLSARLDEFRARLADPPAAG